VRLTVEIAYHSFSQPPWEKEYVTCPLCPLCLLGLHRVQRGTRTYAWFLFLAYYFTSSFCSTLLVPKVLTEQLSFRPLKTLSLQYDLRMFSIRVLLTFITLLVCIQADSSPGNSLSIFIFELFILLDLLTCDQPHPRSTPTHQAQRQQAAQALQLLLFAAL